MYSTLFWCTPAWPHYCPLTVSSFALLDKPVYQHLISCCISLSHSLLGVMMQLGLYKVEFRILEIRISGDTNLKKHFLSGNWIRKKIFWAEKTFEFWISADNSLWILAKTFFFFFFFFWRSPNFGRKNCLNFGFRPIIHSEFWRRPFFFFFFFFFFFGDHLILAGKNCIVAVCLELF